MFGLFRARCPIDADEKAWIESRMRQLAEWIGLERMTNATVVLPTPEFFPDPAGTTAETLQPLFERVCQYMGTSAGEMDFRVFPAESDPDANGTYTPAEDGRKPVVALSDAVVGDPHVVVAVLAHEVAHHVLLGGGFHEFGDPDLEPLTDLLPTFLGLGVFMGNAVLYESAETLLNWHSWQMGKRGYLPGRYHGYAMAVFCWLRVELDPPWVSHVRLDVAERLRKVIRYLEKTDDCLLTRHTVNRAFDAHERVEALGSRHPGQRIGAMWALTAEEYGSDEMVERLIDCLRHSDPAVRREAATALAGLGPRAEAATDELLYALRDGSGAVRCSVAVALGSVAKPDEDVVDTIVDHLEGNGPAFAVAAARGLGRFGAAAISAAPRFQRELRRALIDLDMTRAHPLIESLMQIVPDFDDWSTEVLADEDPEIAGRFREEVELVRAAAEPAV